MTSTRRTRTQRPTERGRRVGFTLMEVLLVLAILGVIGALVVPNLLGSQQKANVNATKNNIKRIEGVLELYAIDHSGQLPASLEELTKSYEVDGVAQQPHLAEIPKDAWGNAFNYKFPGTHHGDLNSSKPDIWSNGPNGTDDNGSGDDVVNWSTEKE